MLQAKAQRPPFASLPLDPSGPPGNAWGLYGPSDELGSLNLLTPSTVVAAAKEIQTGERVSLDWTLDNPNPPFFGREALNIKFYQRGERPVNDDVLHFNTQCGSQWDGFRHCAYQQRRKYYGGRTRDQLIGSKVLGINVWVENGGVVGRGILVDYASYCEKHGKIIEPLKTGAIPTKELKAVAEESNISPKPGDILFVRTGFTKAYAALSEIEAQALTKRESPTDFLGVESSKETVEWIWESGFAAVASDSPTFEQGPTVGPHNEPGGIWKGESWEEEMQGGWLLHQWLLAGWGTPIGEMFDLEGVSKKCQELGRWSFFVSSVPLHVSLICEARVGTRENGCG
jgi:kynurenine formamidase